MYDRFITVPINGLKNSLVSFLLNLPKSETKGVQPKKLNPHSKEWPLKIVKKKPQIELGKTMLS